MQPRELEPTVLTAAVLRVEVLVDGVQRILLLAAMLPGSQDVPDTLVQEGVLALRHREDTGGRGSSLFIKSHWSELQN